jgi:betaine-aldehyde dehydrogenase
MKAGADRFPKVALVLGGKNPHIVFADADLENALDALLHGAFANAGQSCNCGSRLLIDRRMGFEAQWNGYRKSPITVLIG